MDGDAIRRATVFALLFGGAVGFLAWRAGGLRTPRGDAADEAGPDETVPQPGAVAPIGPGLGVGVSQDGAIARDSVKVVDGRQVRFRAWTAAWATATPKKSADPAVGVQDLVRPYVVLYPEPESSSAAPVKAGDPATTTLKANAGVLSYEKDVRTEARLEGDVEVARVDPVRGDFRLRTPSLTCTMESRGDVESRRARTAAPVTIDGGRAHIQGVGLDADLAGQSCVATIARDVKGRFDAPAGSLAMTGSRTDSKSMPTDVTCSGACELVSLGGALRGQDRRWKATFHDDVRVVQGADSLDCDLLEIEFRMGELKADDGMPAQHVVATGNVRVKGATESRTYDVVCGKATHRREGVVGREADVVVFEGSPVMSMFGPLAMAAAPTNRDPKKKSDGRGRMEIRCAGPATMTTRRSGNLATAPHRTSVVFENDVVVRQWDDEKLADVTGELRAPKATLYGTRLATGSFQPDTLTAQDDSPTGPGVDLKRLDFTSHSAAATWTRVGGRDIDKYMLVGEPVVRYSGVRALHPFGKATTSPDSQVTVQSADNVTIEVYDDRPSAPGEGPRPYAVVTAGPRVVLVQSEAGNEVSRATADNDVRAVVAPGKQLEHLEANGNARFRGKTDDGQTRELSGARVILDRLVQPPGAPKDAPHPSQVVALGAAKSQAVAVVEEPGGARDEVRADRLRYAEEGSVIFASGGVVATLDTKGRAEKPGSNLSKVAEGPVRVTAGEARVDLAPAGSGETGGRRLRKIDAGGGVVIDGKLDRIEGKQAVFDAVNGIAEVRGEGQTARVVYSAESARYPSLLLSDLIRAYVDVSDDPAKEGRLTRVVCPGGGRIIRYVDPPDSSTGGAAAGATPRRVQIESKGPMESTRAEATARNDVIARMFSLGKSGEWTDEPMTFYCQHVRVTFDPDAPGPAKDRLRTLVAVGDGARQVVVEASRFIGRADRLELNGPAGTIALSTSNGPKVYVRKTDSGQQTVYDSVVYHFETHEWTDAVEGRVVESDKNVENK